MLHMLYEYWPVIAGVLFALVAVGLIHWISKGDDAKEVIGIDDQTGKQVTRADLKKSRSSFRFSGNSHDRRVARREEDRAHGR